MDLMTTSGGVIVVMGYQLGLNVINYHSRSAFWVDGGDGKFLGRPDATH